jgi:predicted cobalt transporter CbtA
MSPEEEKVMVDPRLAVIAATLDDILATPNLPEANTFEHAQPPRVSRWRDNRRRHSHRPARCAAYAKALDDEEGWPPS